MAFGQHAGPPATSRQVSELLVLLQAAGHAHFRDARGPMGFTQRQAAGKFTRDEAEQLIARLQAASDEEGGRPAEGENARVERRAVASWECPLSCSPVSCSNGAGSSSNRDAVRVASPGRRRTVRILDGSMAPQGDGGRGSVGGVCDRWRAERSPSAKSSSARGGRIVACTSAHALWSRRPSQSRCFERSAQDGRVAVKQSWVLAKNSPRALTLPTCPPNGGMLI